MAPLGIPAPQHLLLLSLSKGVPVISVLQGNHSINSADSITTQQTLCRIYLSM
jgi:hypothetical protein